MAVVMEAASALWNCCCRRVTLRATLKKSIASQVHASHPVKNCAHWVPVSERRTSESGLRFASQA
jgi:hypothetical protein